MGQILSALVRKFWRDPSPLARGTWQERPSTKQKAGSHQTSHLPVFDPGPPHLQNSEKLISIVYKLPWSTPGYKNFC